MEKPSQKPETSAFPTDMISLGTHFLVPLCIFPALPLAFSFLLWYTNMESVFPPFDLMRKDIL